MGKYLHPGKWVNGQSYHSADPPCSCTYNLVYGYQNGAKMIFRMEMQFIHQRKDQRQVWKRLHLHILFCSARLHIPTASVYVGCFNFLNS